MLIMSLQVQNGTPRLPDFVKEFDGRAMSGELIRSVVTLNIIVSWKPNDGQIISFHHAVKVFSIVVERPVVHHIGAQSLDKP